MYVMLPISASLGILPAHKATVLGNGALGKICPQHLSSVPDREP